MSDSRIQMDRRKWLMRLIWVRIAAFTLFILPQINIDLLVLLIAVYALSFCWFGLLRLNRSYIGQAYAQIGVDLMLITWMVNRTGGVDSYFSSLYFLEIVMASLLLKRRGAVQTAIAASLLHGVHLDLAHFEVVPSTQVTFPELITLQYIVGVTIFGFCAVGFLADVMAENLHRSDRALVKSTGKVAFLQELTDRIVDSLGSGLITTDVAGKVYLFNPAAARILGRPSEEAIGGNIRDVFLNLPADAGVGTFEIYESHMSGRLLCLEFSVTALKTGEGEPTGYVWSFDDVTEVREMERQLRHKERMAAIGQMAAGIAHEIRNPLASITGSFALLRSQIELDDEQGNLVDIIARETERLNQTINDFLTYARPIVPRLSAVRLDQLIADSVELWKNNPELGPSHEVETALEPVTAEVDERMIRQVFYNLASNAFKAMPSGGRLEIGLDGSNGLVRIRFADTGVGMNAQQIDRLFLPFNSSFRSGTGLGLSIVYQIVNAHGGSISVSSKPGEGSTFTVELPAERAAAPAEGITDSATSA